MNKVEFLTLLYDFYAKNKRILKWRETIDPYWIFITEIMLQQTQVGTVVNKFELFIEKFPDFKTLAEASFEDILIVWKGLGYNRRALYLKKAAEEIVQKYDSVVPFDALILKTFPGIGHNTASSISTFIYNKPHIFIETNIRSVFLYYFFYNSEEKIADSVLIELIKEYIDEENPRLFYYALMDYGTYLKKKVKGINYKSKHYVKQNAFEGSSRQIRSKILEILLKYKQISENELIEMIQDERFEKVIKNLIKEMLIQKNKNIISLI